MTTTDSLITPIQQQVGIKQPRPEATLHVGGTFIADGLATFRGGLSTGGGSLTLDNLTVGNLTVTGTASVAGAFTAGSVTTPSLQVNGNGTVTGTLTVGGLNGGYINASGLSSSGRLSIAAGDSSAISTPAGSSGSLEVGNNAGGAAKIAFHRHGSFAAYFGIDSDNVWRIGGWSMGGVAYRILDDRDYTSSVTGSKIVQRTPEGYILANYLNTTADARPAGEKPAKIAGQNGDGYIRWYDPAAVGPPSSPPYINGTITRTSIDSNQRQIAVLTVNRTGYWGAAGHYHTTGGTEGADNDLVLDIRFNGVSQGQMNMARSLNSNWAGIGNVVGPALISNGQAIEIIAWKAYSNTAPIDKIGLRAFFVATQAYPN